MIYLDPHFTADDLIIRIPVTFEAGSVITSLTGATVVAHAAPDSGGAAVAGTVAIDPGGAQVTASWAENALIPGSYTVQVRAAKDSYTRTLIERRLRVIRSLP